MSISVTSPVTGAAQTGFTSPTYTVVPDTSPSGVNGEQVAVTALGGTQAGVTTHTIASPFTSSFVRPASFKNVGKPNPITGLVSQFPLNTFVHITRKGVTALAGQPIQVAYIRSEIAVPAGSDTADPSNLRAMVSLHSGILTQQAAGLGDMLQNGII